MFRSTPWDEEAKDAAAGGSGARILFVSESNVCRSVLAEATMWDLLEAHDMQGVVRCESRGSKDYNLNDPPDATLQQVAAELELRCALSLARTVSFNPPCEPQSTVAWCRCFGLHLQRCVHCIEALDVQRHMSVPNAGYQRMLQHSSSTTSTTSWPSTWCWSWTSSALRTCCGR